MTLPGFRRPLCALVTLALALAGSASPDSSSAETVPPVQTAAAPTSSPSPAQATPPPEQSAAPAAPTSGTATSQPARPQQKTITARAVDTVKQVAKSASDIFSRVPCSAPKGGVPAMGSLPHVAGKLVAGLPVVIV